MLTHDLSQTAIATRLGISQGTVSGWMKLGAKPQRRIALALADLLGVRSEWLLRGDEPKLNAESQRAGEQIVKSLGISSGTELLQEEHAAYGDADALIREIRRDLEAAIAAAAGDVGKLGWLREQVRRHASAPEHWEIKARVIQKVMDEERDAEEARRAQSARAQGKAS